MTTDRRRNRNTSLLKQSAGTGKSIGIRSELERASDNVGEAGFKDGRVVKQPGAKRKRETYQASEDSGDETARNRAKKAFSSPSDVVSPDATKKKRRNKTGFPDPNEDTSLSDQAQKCLAYAYLQFHRPSKWKFRKAQQNWLIRNIWSPKEIPEIYFPLALGYLSKVQGGVRENVRLASRQLLDSPVSDQRPDPTTHSPTVIEPVENPGVSDIKRTRAKALLDVLSLPNTVLESKAVLL